LRRRPDKHIDSEELNALVPTRAEGAMRAGRLFPAASREVQSHLDSCTDCRERLRRYQRLVNGVSPIAPASGVPGPDCPDPEDVNWDEIAAGAWPELKARQLILHAATCDFCGPQLKQAAKQRQSAPEKKQLPATPPLPADPISSPDRHWLQFVSLKMLAGVLALFVIVGLWRAIPGRSSSPLSGPEIAQLAVATHRQHAAGHFPLQMVTGSSQSLNKWLQANSRLTVAMPAPSATEPPQVYRPEGVRLLQVNRETAAYIAYAATTPDSKPTNVSLVVAPSSAAIASGGDEVDFPKVSFHYATVDDFKVVTWTVHGMTYALVSQEARTAQRSCLVCHSSVQDPALSRSPKLLGNTNNSLSPKFLGTNSAPLVPVWQ